MLKAQGSSKGFQTSNKIQVLHLLRRQIQEETLLAFCSITLL